MNKIEGRDGMLIVRYAIYAIWEPCFWYGVDLFEDFGLVDEGSVVAQNACVHFEFWGSLRS